MEVKGTIKLINDEQVISDKFKKRELVVTTDDQYPQDILIQFTQDKCDVLNGYNVGDGVEVSINLRGREWTSPKGEVKYFNTIEGWRIGKLQDVPAQAPPIQTPEGDGMSLNEGDDDLPF